MKLNYFKRFVRETEICLLSIIRIMPEVSHAYVSRIGLDVEFGLAVDERQIVDDHDRAGRGRDVVEIVDELVAGREWRVFLDYAELKVVLLKTETKTK